MKNIFKENDVLYRKSNNVKIFKSENNLIEGIEQEINDYENYRDHILHFSEGTSAEWIRWQQVAGDLSKNIFSIYNENIYSALSNIKLLLQDACNHYEINYKRSRYYLSTEYIVKLRTDAWYDFGGIRIPCFSGIMLIDNDPLTIKVNDAELELNCGDIALFEAGHKIRYNREDTKIISFSIAPLSMLKGQYPQKWIVL